MDYRTAELLSIVLKLQDGSEQDYGQQKSRAVSPLSIKLQEGYGQDYGLQKSRASVHCPLTSKRVMDRTMDSRKAELLLSVHKFMRYGTEREVWTVDQQSKSRSTVLNTFVWILYYGQDYGQQKSRAAYVCPLG